MQLKAEKRDCRGCGVAIPAQPSGPGRPREFCSRECRSKWHRAQEQKRVEAERREATEARRYEMDRRWWGKKKADQLARDRTKNRARWADDAS